MAENTMINIHHLEKRFGELEVLKDIEFHVDKGEVITIIGSSGSGKSTLLRCLNLLEIPDSGEILYRGQDILKGELNVNQY
ncbi:ATP-binding cassette domain-containing protein, partial [Turicibacter sanguinis]|nr:ATP-binding cassette domain-containing protein [Turicibacter sanguinis]